MANCHIQNGDVDDSRIFNLDDETASQFNEGWSRRSNSMKNSLSL